MIHQLFESFVFVSNGLFFWQAMAMVTIISMLIGSIVYNGDINMAKKATLVISSYALMLLFTTFARIYENTGLQFSNTNYINAYAGMITTFCITLFYIVGIFLGVLAHKKGRG